MSEYCEFCRIVRKEGSASYIYEDEKVVAFLSIRPIYDGHTLVIPKRHYENIYEVSDEDIAYLFKVVKKVAYAVKKGLRSDGIKIVQNNGKTAGQVVFHLHVHVIPTYEEKRPSWPREINEGNKLNEIAAKVRQFV